MATWWDHLPDESGKWVRITEWPAERRVTWAIGAFDKVVAMGQTKTVAEARRAIRQAQEGGDDAGS